MQKNTLILLAGLILTALLSACTDQAEAAQEKLVVYSGRKENLVQPVIDRFSAATGIEVMVKYGQTAEIASMILEEAENSPADLFWAQDPGGLGAVAAAGMLSQLPDESLARVNARFRDTEGQWVGISGRVRVIVYNTENINPERDLPSDLWGFTDPEWKGRIGWAPTNGSFQAMVTALRASWGEERTREWLQAIIANEPGIYPKNTPIVAAAGSGEIDVGFVNHYYLHKFIAAEGENFAARNFFLPDGGPGSLVMVAGAGILNSAENVENAQKFIDFLLSPVAQQYFAEQTYEYPLVDGIKSHREF